MVDYPSNAAPVLAFVGPAAPAAAHRAALAASRALDELFNAKPRNPTLPPGRWFITPLDALVGCAVSPLLPPVWGVDDPCPLSVTTLEETSSFNDAGWTLQACRGRPGAYAFHNAKLCSSAVASSMPLSQVNWTPWFLYPNIWRVRTFDGTQPGINPGEIYMFRYHGYEKRQSTMPTDSPRWETETVINYSRPSPISGNPLKPAMKVTGAGKIRVRKPALTTKRAKPKRGQREAGKRQPWVAGAFPFRWLLEGGFEGLDTLRAIHDALPPHLRCNGAIGSPVVTGVCMADAVLNNLDSVDWSEALENLVDNEIEDRFYGMFGQMTKREALANGRARGLQAKPSLRYGGWTPCVFCN